MIVIDVVEDSFFWGGGYDATLLSNWFLMWR